MNEKECILEIEQIMASTHVPLFSTIRMMDADSAEYFRHNSYLSALLSKTRSGRGYELHSRKKDACFSYDKASLAANKIRWDNVRLILNTKVYHLHQSLGDEKDCAYSLTRIASCHLSLWQPEEAKRYLLRAEEQFNSVGLSPSSFKLYQDISRVLERDNFLNNPAKHE